ncbi:MAG TPA: efflux RND transporter periplasmic adaptor subunit [Dongiaceae bacterium]|nr:efflux RND transporter periplasmic adaptor subunit [Dongiaceae bacterium]
MTYRFPDMDEDKLNQLHIPPQAKQRPRASFRIILIVVILALAAAFYFAWTGKSDRVAASLAPTNAAAAAVTNAPVVVPPGGSVLTASGYIVNRERIEISPRFMDVVKWIGVRKGDVVTNGQVVVLLDDAEFQAQLVQAEGRLADARANVTKAELAFQRITNLTARAIETQQAADDARLDLESARAQERMAEGNYALAKTYVDWTVIRSPINGVVLEKLVSADELVMPQSFGGARGPSTALLAVADLTDLQVEIDLNESDLSKVTLGQKCRISPEAYPDKVYDGQVAEIAPEADRQKGTLQIKVQIHAPDRFLTPELTAKVDFLK